MKKRTSRGNTATVSAGAVQEVGASKLPSIVDCPLQLGPAAQEEWNRVIGELTARGILTPLDRALLAVYCRGFALWIEATEALQKYGAIVKSPNGYPSPSPYVAIANQQADTMMRIAGEFGFTPASRQRIRPPRSSSPDFLDLEDLKPLEP